MNRMQNELSKRRYMFNASLKWDITDWVNVTGRVRVDNSDSDSYEKYYASTRGTLQKVVLKVIMDILNKMIGLFMLM